MKRSSPIRKRAKPRRNDGRVSHGRIKPKTNAPPTTEEKGHIADVAKMACLACGVRPVQVHHVTASIHGGRISRSPQRVVPLCPRHHKIEFGPRESVEALGHRGFLLTHGVNLLAVADRLWKERGQPTEAD